MRGSSSSRPDPERPPEGERPDVVVDFEFADGLLFVVVANPSSHAALGVRITFEPAFRGLGGEREMTRLALFRRLDFLAPGKRIVALVDSSAAYFARKEPTKVTATVAFRDVDGGRHRREIPHDLSVYRDLPYVVRNL
jgi:hypothetical protein